MTEQHEAEMQMLKELLNKNNIKSKKGIDRLNKCVKMSPNRKGVLKMSETEKKVVSLTHTESTHIIHLPVKWVRELDIEKDTQIMLEYDGKDIKISKLK